ncbi:MAG: metal ABC transporter substrate-binding protein [Candidatus Nanopelagicales bacterium]|nr:metal ABC transporter substrate-binding protein [Candidatus Nanopelagicales bacterium]
MNRPTPGAALGLAAAALLLAGCAATDPAADAAADPSGVSVIATTTVWGDVADQIATCAGAGGVRTLMPVGADPHDFSASSKDVAAMAAADLVIANGLGLEAGLEDALAAAERDGTRLLEVAPELDPLPFGEAHQDEGEAHQDEGEEHQDEGEEHQDEGEQHQDEGEHGHSGDDPHVWLDVARVATAATLIGDALAEQSGDARFAQCGGQLAEELTALDGEITSTLAAIPAERRILVTDHDAFGYFAAAYDFDVAGVVVPGGSTLARPSSAELAALTETVRQSGVPAIFANTANPQALVDALAAEVGDIEVVELYEGSLGEPGSGADTYQGMMRTNAERISAALAG